jgi:hypothetical protein
MTNFYFYNTSGSDDREERIELVNDILQQSGVKAHLSEVYDKKSLLDICHSNKDSLFFIHETDISHESFQDYKKNFFVFFSGGGLNTPENCPDNFKFIQNNFPDGVDENSYVFDNLVTAINAVANGDISAFKALDINNPSFCSLKEALDTFDCAFQIIHALLSESKDVPTDILEILTSSQFKISLDNFHGTPSKKTQMKYYLNSNDCKELNKLWDLIIQNMPLNDFVTQFSNINEDEVYRALSQIRKILNDKS